jgi:putative N6-adenine-specific DNA methylase
LHQRGYGTATNIAPINEVLAAGVLLLSGWDGQGDFLDNVWFRYILAAAMIACNIPANINRKDLHSKNGTIGTMICSTISLIVY